MKNNIEARLIVLNRIFDVYEKFSQLFETVCDEGCAVCCTRNVTLTTLEGYNIINSLNQQEKKNLLSLVNSDITKKRFIPAITINQMAKLCMEGKEVPEEKSDSAWGECPLLNENKCTIYKVRPFACRCMMSKSRCADSGYADMGEYAVTLNNVFMQYIEHIDIGGCFGNLTDILLFAGRGESSNETTESPDGIVANFCLNHALEMLMVPPEHQERIRAVMIELQKI